MARGAVEEPVAVIDPAAAFDIFVTGTFPPEFVGENVRVTYYQDRHAYPGGPLERVIVGRNVFTPAAVRTAMLMMQRLLGDRDGPAPLIEAVVH